MRKGTAKLDRVPTVGLNQQSGLKCTGCGPFDAGRATTVSMVRQRIMRRKPLYLQANSLWLDGAGRFCGLNWLGWKFRAGGRDTFASGGGIPPMAIAPNHQG